MLLLLDLLFTNFFPFVVWRQFIKLENLRWYGLEIWVIGLEMLSSKSGFGKTWFLGKVCPSYFPASQVVHIHLWLLSCQSWVAMTQPQSLAKPKIFTIVPFTESLLIPYPNHHLALDGTNSYNFYKINWFVWHLGIMVCICDI